MLNFSYLADGTKFSALDDEGRGLEYHGSLTFRKVGASRQVESREFSCGRIYLMLGTPTPFVPFYHVKDYLGSVRAVVDGRSGEVVEANDYYAFGSRWETSSSSGTISNRYRFNGKEDQEGEFGVPTLDYGARHYTPSSARWLSMDPLAEKYYDVSPYAFCNNNPVNFVDPDGRFPDLIWDLASVGIGAHSFVQNVKIGNVKAAVGDGIGIVVDIAAAALPIIPGGVGAIRAGAKAANAIDNVADATKVSNHLSDGKLFVTYTKKNPVTREVYSGRASGYGTPDEIVKRRDANHHMNKKGYDPAGLDKSSSNPDAIRGREQYLMEQSGGAKSQGGTSGNAINGISPKNPNKQRYEEARKREFGE